MAAHADPSTFLATWHPELLRQTNAAVSI